ncbi:MAG TPA: molybdenum ABC transporter ATP-binding protein [Lamprocystis sp. (in: g-proteobacteria)]|nr:molybdenum ABC transporter ATP-binding protein [Lamprocystis sp. (in: g-proteobacteria)]
MSAGHGSGMGDGIAARFHIKFPAFTLNVDLDLPGRGVIALFGSSGSGKTTVLRCVAGLQRAEHGHLSVNGETWQDAAQGQFLPTYRRPLGYVFQEASLFPHLSVKRNLSYGMRRIPTADQRVSWDQAIDLLGIGHLLDRAPGGLSGGERQRVGIARALLTSPRLLLLDEPLAALDHQRKQEILPYLERLHDELSIPVLYVSHAPDEVARLADHLVVMEAGRVLASGDLAETLARLDLPIRLGEDAGVVLAGRIAERDQRWHLLRVECGAQSLWVRDTGMALGHAVRVRVLARDVSIVLEPGAGTSIQNTLPARVDSLGDDDHEALTLVKLQVNGAALLARVTRRAADQLGLEPGLAVWVQIKAVAVL